ncbi:hypothetical protein IX336_000704 [Porphyromonas levii]|nr:hypothetical protein [Porphyromonas levii]
MLMGYTEVGQRVDVRGFSPLLKGLFPDMVDHFRGDLTIYLTLRT